MPLQILLPFYGDPALLKITVTSVLGQRNSDWTLTVVDDGYPDDTIPGYFASLDDSRVRYLRNERNLGANGNYRRCVELADTDDPTGLIVILGADDELLPNYVDTILAAHRAYPEAAIIQPGVQVIDEHGHPREPLVDRIKRLLRPKPASGREVLGGGELAASLLRGNWLYFPSLAFAAAPVRRIGFRDGLDVVQDLALVIDLLAAGYQLVLDDTVCFRYRRHSASDSSWRALAGTRFNEERRFFHDAADQVAALGWTKAARVSRRHLLSRANAATVLPRALLARRFDGAATLARHAFGFGR